MKFEIETADSSSEDRRVSKKSATASKKNGQLCPFIKVVTTDQQKNKRTLSFFQGQAFQTSFSKNSFPKSSNGDPQLPLNAFYSLQFSDSACAPSPLTSSDFSKSGQSERKGEKSRPPTPQALVVSSILLQFSPFLCSLFSILYSLSSFLFPFRFHPLLPLPHHFSLWWWYIASLVAESQYVCACFCICFLCCFRCRIVRIRQTHTHSLPLAVDSTIHTLCTGRTRPSLSQFFFSLLASTLEL